MFLSKIDRVLIKIRFIRSILKLCSLFIQYDDDKIKIYFR